MNVPKVVDWNESRITRTVCVGLERAGCFTQAIAASRMNVAGRPDRWVACGGFGRVLPFGVWLEAKLGGAPLSPAQLGWFSDALSRDPGCAAVIRYYPEGQRVVGGSRRGGEAGEAGWCTLSLPAPGHKSRAAQERVLVECDLYPLLGGAATYSRDYSQGVLSLLGESLHAERTARLPASRGPEAAV